MSKEKEPLFSKKNRALLTDPLDDEIQSQFKS